MISLTKKRDQTGFTIVELLIVIVVIGILAALVVTTYAGIQAKARDAKRQTDVQAIQTQIEAFYASNNYYPALVDVNSSTWRAANMKSLDIGAITDPSYSGANPQLINTTPTAASKAYEYLAKDSTGAECTTGETDCASYTLQAFLENGGKLYTKTNLD